MYTYSLFGSLPTSHLQLFHVKHTHLPLNFMSTLFSNPLSWTSGAHICMGVAFHWGMGKLPGTTPLKKTKHNTNSHQMSGTPQLQVGTCVHFLPTPYRNADWLDPVQATTAAVSSYRMALPCPEDTLGPILTNLCLSNSLSITFSNGSWTLRSECVIERSHSWLSILRSLVLCT